MAADPIQRELCLGLPVASGDAVVLQHVASGLLLCREAKLRETDFGAESLVTGHTLTAPPRQNFLEKTAQVPCQGFCSPNPPALVCVLRGIRMRHRGL